MLILCRGPIADPGQAPVSQENAPPVAGGSNQGLQPQMRYSGTRYSADTGFIREVLPALHTSNSFGVFQNVILGMNDIVPPTEGVPVT